MLEDFFSGTGNISSLDGCNVQGEGCYYAICINFWLIDAACVLSSFEGDLCQLKLLHELLSSPILQKP